VALIEAKLRDVREGAGAHWWGTFFQGQSEPINRRFREAQVVYWTASGNMPLDLFSYLREAAACYVVARFLASIVLSSSAIELILNRDSRTKSLPSLRRVGKWATLNNGNLEIANGYGLPASLLLSAGETLVDATPITFVTRRNKIAHGEIFPLIKDLSDYDPHAESEAVDQLKKSQKFIVEWFNTAPDVQSSKIQNHKWPT
jgi:hypothetical protein